MAIAKMNRFTLLTFHTHKQALLKGLQVFGDVHIKTPEQEELEELSFLRSDFSQEHLSQYEAELEKVRFATGKIAPYVEKAKMGARRPALTFEEFDRYATQYDYGEVYAKVKEQDDAIAGYRNDIARREAENDTLIPWRRLDVDPGTLETLSETQGLLGTVNKLVAEEFRQKMEQQFDTVYVELLDTVKDDTTLLVLMPAELSEDVGAFARELGFTKAASQFRGEPAKIIEGNNREIRELNKKLEAAVDAIRALAPEHAKLQIALDYFGAVLERERACRNFLASETSLLIEGWVPVDESAKLHEILKGICGDEYYLQEEAVEKDSTEVPIKLRNNKFNNAFESITVMYSLPRYNEIDPTPLLAPFYWLFFGMMVGDMGYGLLMLIATTVALKVVDLKEGMRNFMQFFRFLSIAVILVGIVYGSAFGVSVFKPISYVNELGEIASKPLLDSQLDITTMLIISIIIGVIQLCFGLLVKAYMGFRDGDIPSGLFDGIFWLVALLSGIGWLVSAMGIIGGPMVGEVCKWIFILSLIGLAATQGRSSPSIGGKIGNGLYGVYGITSYVGDVVSYTRLVALGLSGAYIAYAFNIMTELVVGNFSEGNIVVSLIRLIFGIVIVLVGHTLNVGLSLLGAYVHSCRLQYVEYFGKFYEGGGRVFRPLSLKPDHIHITK